jgi:hypothetical protein
LIRPCHDYDARDQRVVQSWANASATRCTSSARCQHARHAGAAGRQERR